MAAVLTALAQIVNKYLILRVLIIKYQSIIPLINYTFQLFSSYKLLIEELDQT